MISKWYHTIRHCFNEHRKEHGKLYFDIFDYAEFWISHEPGSVYEMKNKDGSVVQCKVAYYPLPYYKDLRACIEIPMKDGIDLRDVPVKFLTKVT